MDSFKDIWSLRKPGALDSTRHKERIKRAIKENIQDLIAQENIITSHGNKKIKVPMKYLDLWRFKHGKNDNQHRTGHGPGKPGDVIAREGGSEGPGGNQAGNEEGEEIYNEEVELDEIIEMMLEDLNLPWLEEKEKSVDIETEQIVFHDISEKGIPANIDKRRTVLENMKRNAKKGKLRIKGISQDDVRYKLWEKVVEKHSNAAVFLLMDRSYSMTDGKKYIVKSFFFWMVNFLRRKYSNVDLVFIAHDVKARETEEEDFFKISQGGGTLCSSALQLAKNIIEDRYPPNIWNNFVFSFSDGDNWRDDNKKCRQLVKDLLKITQSVGYGEVFYNDYFYKDVAPDKRASTLMSAYLLDPELNNSERFIVARLDHRDDIYKCLKTFLKGVPNE